MTSFNKTIGLQPIHRRETNPNRITNATISKLNPNFFCVNNATTNKRTAIDVHACDVYGR